MRFLFLLLGMIFVNQANSIVSETSENCGIQIPVEIKVTKESIKLCNTEYDSYFSKRYKIPLVTVEKLEDSDFEGTDKRQNRFIPDKRLKLSEQASSASYYNSGYDRGHLAAAANVSTKIPLIESFFFTNIAPQNPDLNRTTWKTIESFARQKKGFVITGVGFDNCEFYESLKTNVAVPDYFWKIIIPEDNKIRMFLASNKKPDKSITKYLVNFKDIQSKLCGVHIFF